MNLATGTSLRSARFIQAFSKATIVWNSFLMNSKSFLTVSFITKIFCCVRNHWSLWLEDLKKPTSISRGRKIKIQQTIKLCFTAVLTTDRHSLSANSIFDSSKLFAVLVHYLDWTAKSLWCVECIQLGGIISRDYSTVVDECKHITIV